MVMRQTVHEALDDKFRKNPEWYSALGDKWKAIENGEYPLLLKDCAYQYSRHTPTTLYDIYFFAKIYADLYGTGRVAVRKIPLAKGPNPDADIKGNNVLLSELPEPFTGEFWGGTQGADGILKWIKPIHVWVFSESDKKVGLAIAPPSSVEIEAGTNSSDKFHFAVTQRNGVARWPYGQAYLTVFINVEHINLVAPQCPNFSTLKAQCIDNIEHPEFDKTCSYLDWMN